MDMKTSPLSLLNDPTLLKTDALINGVWVPGSQRFDVHDPATGQKLADVANLGPAEAEAAIAAADAAWAAWRNKTGKERSIVLRKWYDLLMANVEDLGRLQQRRERRRRSVRACRRPGPRRPTRRSRPGRSCVSCRRTGAP